MQLTENRDATGCGGGRPTDSGARRRARWGAGVALRLALLLPLLPQFALADWPKTRADFARLPRYCSAKFDLTTPADRKRWEQRIGPDFVHIHHYCAALFTLSLANSTLDAHAQQLFLDQAVKEIIYVEKHAKPNFFMRAEMGVQKAYALVRMKQVGDALQSFNASLKVNPRYVPAYLGMANLYASLGKTADARKVLDRGLGAVPGSKALRARRAALD